MFARGETRRWRSTVDVTWNVGHKESPLPIIIPLGTEFESSIPWVFTWIINPDDPRFLLAALVHDYILENKIQGRAQAAAEWYDGTRKSNAPRFLSKLAYLAVAFWAVFGKQDDK